MRRPQRAEAGSAIAALLVVVVICGAIAVAVLMPAIGRHREAEAHLQGERAFQLSEAGVDWAIAAVRRLNGSVPSSTSEQRTVGSLGEFVLRYEDGGSNARDDDGDGVADDPDEEDLIVVRSTGRSGEARRTVEVLLRKSVDEPSISASVQFNVTTPIVDLKGNAFLISGADHDVDGNEDTTALPKAGIASPADTADIESQIDASRVDQVQGAGGTPSLSQVSAIDLARLVAQAQTSASVRIESGTHTHLALGTATEAGVIVAYADGDIHLSGSAGGAGVLVVDGDLTISGSFTWQGLVIVRGRVRMTGGGSTKRIIGGLVIGEEISNEASETEVSVSGTVDLLYSSEAVRLATRSMTVTSVMLWHEVANP